MLGINIIGKEKSAKGDKKIKAFNPSDLTELEGEFPVATKEEVEKAVQKAEKVALEYAALSDSKKAQFLRAIADNIENLGDTLVSRVMGESGLPEGRVKGERGRTCGQLRFFASKLEEGSWVNAIIDQSDPDRTPPKPDVRQYLKSIGPVVIFTASNFPLAFSTAGGDTASALAAGCPVIIKAHESHLGTNQLIAEAIRDAAEANGIPDGVFSSLNGDGYELGKYLVSHPAIKAVAFTGSFNGGKTLYDIAQQRDEPIPVFAEMGSVNPVFILPGIFKNHPDKWAEAISNSVNLGAGQFCTNPGLIIVKENEYLLAFEDQLKDAFSKLTSATMLNPGIHKNFETRKTALIKETDVDISYIMVDDDKSSLLGHPCLLEVPGSSFLKNPKLAEEVFGPLSILVICKDENEYKSVLLALEGQLTITFLGETDDLNENSDLLNLATTKAGRVIINALPTGVEVCEAMNHGGPFPSTTDVRFTSVGGNAIYRFVRPVCFQGFPDKLLPEALKSDNPLNIWRKIDGVLQKD